MPSEVTRPRDRDDPPINQFAGGASSGEACGSVGAVGSYRNTGKGPWDATVGCIELAGGAVGGELQGRAVRGRHRQRVPADAASMCTNIPARSGGDNEDLGRLRQQIQVDGYVFGDRSDLLGRIAVRGMHLAAQQQIDDRGGHLYLPMRVPLWAVCQSVESTFNADRMGRIDFSMSFSIEPRGYNTSDAPTEKRKPHSVELGHGVHIASNRRRQERAGTLRSGVHRHPARHFAQHCRRLHSHHRPSSC